MKNLTNILSYLWLLLLMAVTACSDLEEEVGPMHVEEEVELTIQTEVSGMKGSTRTAPTESITAITAYAFDSNSQLIKEVKAILSDDKQATSGNLRIKVPKRTGDIHFIAKNSADTPDVTIKLKDNVSTLLSQTTDDLHYWGKTTFDGTNATLPVTLYRNMAKVTLVASEGSYIAGFLNYNSQGTLVPSEFTIGTINAVSSLDSHDIDNELGTEHYLFEHANEKNNNPLYAICNIGGKYYKIAFATNNNGELNHFPIVRNHQYNININEIETALGSNRYEDAVAANPINNAVVTEVELSVTAETNELYFNNESTVTVTATVPVGVSALAITAPEFDVTTTSDKVTKTSDYNYTVNSAGDVEFTFTLKDGSYTDNQPVSIQFTGTAEYGYELTNPEAISIILKAQKTVSIVAVPSATTLNYAASSVEDLLVNVTIPKAVTKLSFSSDDFTIKVASGELVAVENEENSYTITHDENATETTIPVRIRLNDGVDKETASFTFNGTSDDANVEVQSVTKEIALTADGDENVRWQGNVPLNGNVYANIVPLMYDWFLDGNNFIPVGSKLDLEFTVTGGNGSTLQVFEICGNTEDDWNDPVHQFAELNNSNTYTATGDGNNTLSLTLSEATFNTISENFRNDFLGETGDENKIAMAIRGTGITLTKVSIVPVEVTPTSNILVTAPDATEGVSNASVDISYSNSSAIEEYTITVTVPDGVTQLNYSNNGFSYVYIDYNGWYDEAKSPINISDTKSIPLRLRVNKGYNSNPTITFSANNVESATFTVNRTEGSTDSNVLWEGALLFQGYNVHVSKIDIPNDLLQGKVFDGAVLTVEYEVINDNDDFLSIYGSGISNWANLKDVAAENYSDNNYSTITMTLNPTIIENIGSSSINMQGYGRVLKKVTLTPPANVTFNVLEETISLDLATNETVLYVQKPANVNQLTITDNENLFGTVSTTFANANVNGKTINNLPNDAATIPIKLEITRVVDIKNYTITVATNDGRSDNVTINLLSTWSGSHSLGEWEGFWGSARKLPVGSTVQITFADYDDCSFELHTYNSSTEFGYDVRLRDFSTTADGEDYISTSYLTNGVFTFTVATDGSVMIRNNGNLNNVTDAGLDGLQINGGNRLSITQVNVTLGGGEITPTGFTYNFDDGVEFGGWNNHITTDIVYDDVRKSIVFMLVVSQNNDKFGQIGISNGDYSGNYTLSIKYRAESSTGNMNLVFQDEANNYAVREKYVEGTLSTSWKEITWDLNLTEHADQFVIQFEQVDANATFYIDDLKLVKNN